MSDPAMDEQWPSGFAALPATSGLMVALTLDEIRMAADALDFALGYGGEDGLPGVEEARSALKKLRDAPPSSRQEGKP